MAARHDDDHCERTDSMSRMLRVAPVLLPALILTVTQTAPAGPITIGAGPWIGTDTAGNAYNEEFQDWTHADCRALDGAGTAVGGRYNHNDGRDDSRDLIAFYSREEGDNYYFRVDLYDLALGAETGSLDIYVAIDCAFGGQAWMPDFTDVQVDPNHAYEVCIKLYDTFNHDVIDSGFNSIGGFVGAYYNSEIDAVEFGISRQTLINQGWNGSSVMYFTVMTVRDGSNGGAGEISGGSGTTSDATDTFFDDGRGFDDGVINGAIASNAGTGRAKYASIAHGNQSINQAEALRVHIYDPPTFNKTGFIRTLDTHEIFNVPINLHLSGSLIVASRWAEAAPGDDPLTDGPAFLNRVAEFVNADQQDGKPGSLIGGVFAEHIMPYFEGAANASSIQLFNELMLNEFGLTPADVPVMHTPERVIRSNSTGLSPLDGHTFEDIEAESLHRDLHGRDHAHALVVLSRRSVERPTVPFDAPHQHKIHLINGVYCFAINDREDQAKFGPHDGGMALDTRFAWWTRRRRWIRPNSRSSSTTGRRWPARALTPGTGISVENNNQWQYQQTIRWAANHPWIENRQRSMRHSRPRDEHWESAAYDAGWVIDHGYSFYDLSLQTYEWLKHAIRGQLPLLVLQQRVRVSSATSRTSTTWCR
jgi:hypothetical protein